MLSILLTAPIGAVTIALSGPRLLKRTAPPLTDGWRRHARPSLRDISIYDEDELRDEDEEEGPDTPQDEQAIPQKSEITRIWPRPKLREFLYKM